MIFDPPVSTYYKHRQKIPEYSREDYGPYDCRVMDAEGNIKYIITGEFQINEDLARLKKSLHRILDRT